MAVIREFKGQYSWLSNFYPCYIVWGGHKYPSVEHAFQAAKTHDGLARIAISQIPTAGKAKKAGNKLVLRSDWEQVKDSIMEDLIRIKFSYPQLRQRLLDTGTNTLVEGNWWHDNYWGYCTCKPCRYKHYPLEQTNHLGFILMKVRDELLAAQYSLIVQDVRSLLVD